MYSPNLHTADLLIDRNHYGGVVDNCGGLPGEPHLF